MANQSEPEPFEFPVETEIIIQPDGRVVVADLPIELASLITKLHTGIGEAVATPTCEESRTDWIE